MCASGNWSYPPFPVRGANVAIQLQTQHHPPALRKKLKTKETLMQQMERMSNEELPVDSEDDMMLGAMDLDGSGRTIL